MDSTTLRLLAAAVVTILVLVRAASVSACSCIPFDAERFEEAEAAVVATVSGVRTPLSGLISGDNVWQLQVEDDLKSNVGPGVSVVGRRGPGSACGLSLRVGDRRGFFLARDGAHWRIGGCSVVAPRTILELAAESGGTHTAYDQAPLNHGTQPLVLFGVGALAAALATIGLNRRQSS